MYKIIKEINLKYFNNKMDKKWKKYIKQLIKKYGFDKKAVITLFDYCNSKKSLEQDYIESVAKAWIRNDIRTGKDLENYLNQCNKLNKTCKMILDVFNNITPGFTEFERRLKQKDKIKTEISKNTKRKLNEFEIAYIEKWLLDYKLSEQDIVEAFKENKNFRKTDIILFKKYIHNKTNKKST